MTKAQKRLRELRTRQSQERGKMAELALLDELTDEQRSELDGIEAGTPDLERLLRAAETAVETEEAEQRSEGPDLEDGEGAELRAIRERVTMAGFFAAALEGRGAAGAESELNAALKIPLLGIAGGTQFPLELLAPRTERRETSDTDTTTMPRRWLDRLFAGTAAMHLGITMESVPTGVASFPVTTAGAAAAQRGRTEAAADAGWTIGVSEMKPKRNAVRAVFTIEDAARIPALESALNRDLRMALVEGVDRAIFLGDAGANENSADIAGLNTLAITEHTLSQADKVKWPETVAEFSDMLDGIHAGSPGDLKIVAAVGASRLWMSTQANSNRNESLAQIMQGNGLSWMTRGSIEDDTDDGDLAAFIGRARGIEGAGVAAVWEAGELIRDPYSKSATGEVALTLCNLWDFGLPRLSNFRRLAFGA